MEGRPLIPIVSRAGLGALLVLASAPALAFGPTGHRVVGEIAELQLCAETRAFLAPLLNGESLADAGVWADRIRDDPRWERSGPWHYINVDDAGADETPRAARAAIEKASRRSPDNVIAALARFEADLANSRLPRERRREALRFVVHFVADIHQPLHVGRASDRGGNEIDVELNGNGTDLHAVWDAEALLKGDGLQFRERVAALAPLGVGSVAAWQTGGPLDWAVESRDLRPWVYRTGRGGRLPRAYVAMARNVVGQRLVQAGVRLAGRLNQQAAPGCRLAPPAAVR